MTPAQENFLRHPWNRQDLTELRQDARPIVVELKSRMGRGQPCRQVTSGQHRLFVHRVDYLCRLGLLRLVSETAGKWVYAVVTDDASRLNQGP